MITISRIKGFSRKGIRENNEDYIIYGGDKHHPVHTKVVVLCDGMGGHSHGEVASKIVAESVYSTLSCVQCDSSELDLQCALDKALEELNDADLYGDEKKMGTTIVVVVVNNDDVLVGHVGDSRCYLFDENGIKKFRTKDHSKVAEAVEAEILTEEEAINSQYKNILTRCVMAGKTGVKIEVDRVEVQDKDKFLLCTDGVVDALHDECLSAILVNRSVDDSLEMINSECERKSHDNYSAIIVELRKEEKKKLSGQSKETSSYDYAIHSDEHGELEYLRKELAYMKIGLREINFKRKALWCFYGFMLALLIVGVISFVFLNRVYEQSENDKKIYNRYMARCDSITKVLSTSKSTADTLILRSEIENAFKQIMPPCNSNSKMQ